MEIKWSESEREKRLVCVGVSTKYCGDHLVHVHLLVFIMTIVVVTAAAVVVGVIVGVTRQHRADAFDSAAFEKGGKRHINVI